VRYGCSNRRVPMPRKSSTALVSVLSLRVAIYVICASASRSCLRNANERHKPPNFTLRCRSSWKTCVPRLDAALVSNDVLDGGELLANIYGSWRTVGLDAEGTARCEAYLATLPAGELLLRARLESVMSDLLSGSGHKVRAFEWRCRRRACRGNRQRFVAS